MSAQLIQTPLCVVAGVGPGNGAAFARRFAAQGYAVASLARMTGLTNKLTNELPWHAPMLAMWATPPATWEPSAASSLRCLLSQLEEAEIDFVARRHQLCSRGVARTPKDTNLNRAGR